MSRSITIIAFTGLLGTVGLTMAMGQVLSMHPEQGKEHAAIEGFQTRFRPHCEGPPELKVLPGSVEGRVRVVASLTPKVTEDRQRLFFLLRDHLWRTPYAGGRPEHIVARVKDPVTGQVGEIELPESQSRTTRPAPAPRSRPVSDGGPASRPAADRSDVQPRDAKR